MNRIPFSVYDFFGYLAAGFVLVASLDYAFELGWLDSTDVPAGRIALALLVIYVLGHAVAHLSSVVLEQLLVRRVLRSPEEHLLSDKPPSSKWRRLFRAHYQRLPEETRERIANKAARAGINSGGRALFLHCHQIVKGDEVTRERLDTFLNLYGFCRNLSMALILGWFIVGVSGLRILDWPVPDPSQTRFIVSGGLLLAASVMFLRYLKFFRHYTREVFLSYAEISALFDE